LKRIFIIVLFIGSIFLLYVTNVTVDKNKKVNCNYYTPLLFKDNLIKSTKYNIKNKPIAIVVPHNESIMDMTASVFSSINNYKYDTIVILSVNHQAKKGKMLLSSVDFETPLGIVYGDTESKKIIKNSLGKNIIEDDEVVEQDHAASVLMPYIKTYMPDVNVVTLLFTSKTTLNEVNHISETLNELSEEKNILLIGSVDFSHYQSYEDTVKYDEETIDLIETFNSNELKTKDGRFLDSAEAIGVILNYAKLKDINKVNILEHRIVSNIPFTNDYGSYITMYI